jgi:hypothetical protein
MLLSQVPFSLITGAFSLPARRYKPSLIGGSRLSDGQQLHSVDYSPANSVFRSTLSAAAIAGNREACGTLKPRSILDHELSAKPTRCAHASCDGASGAAVLRLRIRLPNRALKLSFAGSETEVTSDTVSSAHLKS